MIFPGNHIRATDGRTRLGSDWLPFMPGTLEPYRPDVPGMTLLGIRRFAASNPVDGDVVNDVAIYRHEAFARALGLDEGEHDPAAEFVLIPGGTFMQGSPEDEAGRREREGPQRRVTVQPFLLARTQVTQRVWRELAGSTDLDGSPSLFSNAGDRAPVEQVSWDDVVEWCEANGLRLPSEAEWEFACRAGTMTRYASGDSESDLAEVGWYCGNSGLETHEVAEKEPNAFGLYDMHGNVWEWCRDSWDDSYRGAPTDGSAREDADATKRVFRGGGWFDFAWGCRSAYRFRNWPGNRWGFLGFRPAMSY